MSIRTLYEDFTRWFLLKFTGKVKWKLRHGLTEDDLAILRTKLTNDYYIILTHRRNHLSTYLTSIANFLLTGRFGFWSHSLMNLEDSVKIEGDFRLIEAVSKGVEYTPFAEVFNVDAVALLKPKNVPIEQWTVAMDAARTYLGRPYDTLFDIVHDDRMSCVELVLTAMRLIPGYQGWFTDFEAMIAKRKNLTPQMFFDCDDFEVVYMIRR